MQMMPAIMGNNNITRKTQYQCILNETQLFGQSPERTAILNKVSYNIRLINNQDRDGIKVICDSQLFINTTPMSATVQTQRTISFQIKKFVKVSLHECVWCHQRPKQTAYAGLGPDSVINYLAPRCRPECILDHTKHNENTPPPLRLCCHILLRPSFPLGL